MKKRARRLFPGAITLPRLVGRENILKEINSFLPPVGLRVFYLKGVGGVGKTRLLQEVLRIAQKRARQDNLAVSTELVDFYHYSTHSEEGLARAIYAVLPDESRSFFWDYDEKRREIRAAQQEGVYEQAATLHGQMLQAFQTGLRQLAKSHPLVLTFDTLEVLSHSAPIGKVLGWLVSLLTSLEGQVLVLIAGRPDPDGEEQLQAILGNHLRTLSVEALSLAEVLEYFRALEEMLESLGEHRSAQRLKAVPSEMRETIALLTGGRPILIALTADLILGQSQVQQVFLESSMALGALSEDELRERQQEAQREILNHLRGIPSPLRETLDLLSLTHKGMSPGLLAYLQDTTLPVARDRLEEMFKFSFVKFHPIYDDRVYLHDEMYELLEADAPNPQRRVNQTGRIADWYGEEIARVTAELQGARENKTGGVVLEDLRQRLQGLEVEKVHYLLRKDPFEGLIQLVELSLDAYFSADLSLDTYLESEAREFLWRKGDFDLRRALEWELTLARVRADIRQTNWKGADALLSTLEAQQSPGALHTAHKEIWRAYFLVQTGQYAKAEQSFEQAKRNLFGAAIIKGDRFKVSLQALLHHWQGYTFRLQGKNQMAAEAYQHALPLLRWLHNDKVLTDVLKNLAFALAELGNTVAAQRLIEDALGRAERQGTRYLEGLCWNTVALVAIRAGDLERAVESAQNAFTLFQDIQNPWGRGLACTALAETYRRLALTHKEDPRQQRREIEKAKECGEQAVGIFKEKFREPVREIEALVEAGCAYRDHVRIERESFGIQAEWLKHAPDLVDKGQEYLEEAAELAKDHIPYRAVDAWVNLAMLELFLEDFVECTDWLSKAEEFVPKEYKIRAGEPYPPTGGENPGFWLALGKLYQVRAQALWLQYKEDLSHDTIDRIWDWITLAMAYDELFQPESFGARRGQDGLYSVLQLYPMTILQQVYRAVWKTSCKYGLPRSKEHAQERTLVIRFLEHHFGPSDLHLSEEEMEQYWEET